MIHANMGHEIKVLEGISLPGLKGAVYDGPMDDLIEKWAEKLNWKKRKK